MGLPRPAPLNPHNMNAARRKELNKLIGQLEDIKSQIEELQQEEQDAYDNLPESLQDGERGERMQELSLIHI